jgi:hypothetical protein
MKSKLTITELKKEILKFYGYELEHHMDREMIITQIKNQHGTVGTVVFSVNGSPPKGIAILVDSSGCYTFDDSWKGNLILIGNRRVSKIRDNIEIIKDKLFK